MTDYHLKEQEIRELILRYESELHKLQYQTSKTQETISELKASLQSSTSSLGKAAAKPQTKPAAKPQPEAAVEAPAAAEEPVEAPEAPAQEATEEAPAAEVKKERRQRITAKLPKPRETQPAEKKGSRGRPRKDGTQGPAVAKEPKAAKKAKADANEGRGGYRLSTFDLYIIEALNQKGYVLINNELQSFIEGKLAEIGESVPGAEVMQRISRSLHKMTNRRNDVVQVHYAGRGHAYALPEWVDEKGNTKAKFQRK